ncbi:DUF4421 family protein [Chryseobacterium fistulae]|uniref:DUF4421 domain-containing protein n=1 Tax=Chryseobacterium fistulae TaxID=2675058 RepID=A0A6N4XT58_9FLAO|nr:DUF4421 family protein [Chryseobacterium fistulae]CAA7392677.1 hypothetical protein CHRY9393_03387 [Chryseobacterium fistulae]
MKIKELFVCLLFFFALWAKGQVDTTHIKSYSDQVMIRFNLDTNIEKYIVSDHSFKEKVTLAINNRVNTSLSLDYKIISASLSFAPHFIPGNNENDLKGHSSYTDFRFRLFLNNFIQTVYYKKVKGFYVENMKESDPSFEVGKEPYIQLPDFKVRNFGGITAYVLNKNASLKSVYTQGEWQKKSRGSFMPFLDYEYTIFNDIIDGEKTKDTEFDIGANMGYFYNWIIAKKINISPYFALGFGGKFTNYEDIGDDGEITKEKGQYFTSRFAGGLHIGYNTDRFLFGGKINFNSHFYNQEKHATVENNNIYGLIYVGYRFAPPKVVKNSYEKISKKIPIL